MKIYLNKKNYHSGLIIILGLFSIIGQKNFAQDLKKNSLQENQIDSENFIKKDELLPMPLGNFSSASKKVDINRNPFKEQSFSAFPIISNINSNLKFKGLLYSDKKIKAIIEIAGIQKLYKEGDLLSNGFLIKTISIQDTSVDISDGTKNFRLKLYNLRN